MTAVIFRRRRLGAVTGGRGLHGVAQASETGITVRTHNPIRRTRKREGPWPDDTSLIFRWGCTATIPVDCDRVVNRAEAIHLVNDKTRFRTILSEHDLCPWTMTEPDSPTEGQTPYYPLIVRPRHHAQGRAFCVCHNLDDFDRATEYCGAGYYASELINKVAEYRVFVVQGRVVWVAHKTPGNPDQVAWNVAQGGRFDNVRWGDWPLRAVKAAIQGFNLSGLDFGGVDVMMDEDGRAYIIEINSAPSQTSPYRISATAKAFDWIVQNDKHHIPLIEDRGDWKKFIHPALSERALVPKESGYV